MFVLVVVLVLVIVRVDKMLHIAGIRATIAINQLVSLRKRPIDSIDYEREELRWNGRI